MKLGRVCLLTGIGRDRRSARSAWVKERPGTFAAARQNHPATTSGGALGEPRPTTHGRPHPVNLT